MIRTGIGYDVHALVEGRPLVLGGVTIEHPLGLAGHSDGDAVLHAIADAILGAAALGDIGHFFPPDDPRFENVDSRKLLADVAERIAREGWSVSNVDATILAESPRMAPHRAAMCGEIARVLGIDAEAVSVKATTLEGLGPLGRGEGIACLAVATLASRR